ncbi:hypothetical protein DFQ14_101309 [Halopolyspora algeriensis]|uniref:Uncharacterized protein n=1 Tax=Halopolyspora algeriensis TaxID=1500506 RepID=A0A368VZV6_9ACTN|nr:hypothetical protein DFQ14_101309 [Halopolyspora algeriensis]
MQKRWRSSGHATDERKSRKTPLAVDAHSPPSRCPCRFTGGVIGVNLEPPPTQPAPAARWFRVDADVPGFDDATTAGWTALPGRTRPVGRVVRNFVPLHVRSRARAPSACQAGLDRPAQSGACRNGAPGRPALGRVRPASRGGLKTYRKFSQPGTEVPGRGSPTVSGRLLLEGTVGGVRVTGYVSAEPPRPSCRSRRVCVLCRAWRRSRSR